MRFLFGQDIGLRLLPWHCSQRDPIYEVGSLIYDGQQVEAEHLQRCIASLEQTSRHPLIDDEGAAELKVLIETLETSLEEEG